MDNIKIFFFNGQKYQVNNNGKLRLIDLIKYFNYHGMLFILEYNNILYDKKKWGETYIENKDKIEIISIVGGG